MSTATTSRTNIDGISPIGNYPYNTNITYITKPTLTHYKEKIIGGDTVQVYLDFDNNRMFIKKLGTTIEDYENYITY